MGGFIRDAALDVFSGESPTEAEKVEPLSS